jgi:copper chaperone CopZ
MKGTTMTTETFSVTGMTCGHCVAAVTEEITALDGVSAVDVALVPAGTSTVTVESQEPLDHDQVAEAVDEAGYALAGPRDLPLA